MSPRRLRSGKVLSPEAEAPGSVKLLGHLGLDPGLGLGLELSMLLVIVPPVVLVPPVLVPPGQGKLELVGLSKIMKLEMEPGTLRRCYRNCE